MGLEQEVHSELIDAGADDRATALLLAAIAGDDALADALEDGDVPAPSGDELTEAGSESVYLSALTVEGFRGIGPETTIEFEPGPGLTVVVGRNGSGKSSFSDALEVALTGDSYRWKDKAAEWKRGWRNLHRPDTAGVEAHFTVDGHRGGTVVHRSWDAGVTDIDDASAWSQHHGETRTDLDGLGWANAIELYRPLLSYTELGVILSNPSTLFDTLSAVLGLEQLTSASERLRQSRLANERIEKDAKKRLKDQILPQLEDSDDPRAARCVEALSGRNWDLDIIREVVAVADNSGDGIAQLTRLEAADTDVSTEAAESLRSALGELDALRGTDTAQASRIIDLLSTAVDHHDHTGDTACPVCGQGRLDDEWKASANTQIDDLRATAQRYKQARSALDAAVKRAHQLLAPIRLPDDVDGVDLGPLRSAIAALSTAPSEPAAMIGHLEQRYPAFRSELTTVVDAARRLHSETEEHWRPLALLVTSWLENADEAIATRQIVSDLKTAESHAKTITDTLRTRRFEPIASQALDLWSRLRLQSNVELTSVDLAGSGTRRRVDLSVNVDGTEGAALGVVSQGEINCLALSLFFPRATLPESPFRFIVIDDPVQAMDPARVDGLARVFADLAADRQLIVFTHDDRLPESLRRLGLAHALLEVTRRPGSIVETRRAVDPVYQYFQDAWATAKDDDLPDGVAARVVPGMCRMGIEAACHTRIRRNLLGNGLSHSDVERRIAAATTLHQITALALFGDVSETGKVLGHLNSWGREMADVFQACNKGSHGPYHGSLENMTNDAKSLSQRILNA